MKTVTKSLVKWLLETFFF